ncbi:MULTISPECIES: hypothetical protein [Undibacterium]|jgi:hypothetical protein|uniref:Transposase, Mutator family n=1 Tax=Undibacterium luofuense TaxID=2828733 RepID=A0A941I8A5_9BURK|nr:hypothetical protein [Undibacterium luofuense]MBR7782663.1 hypothetical protein [Undibacterium luofuense]
MLQSKDPQAWQQLIRLLAERVASDVLSRNESEPKADLRDNSCKQSNANHHARNHLRSV